jgi:hypothetical protein
MRSPVRVAIVALLACGAIASALALEGSGPRPAPRSPAAVTLASPTASPIRGDVFGATPTPCRTLRTPEPNNPPHAPVNGEPSLGVPTLSGVILVEIAQCRDIQAILRKYGLPGPATKYIGVPDTDEMIANGAARWYRIVVTPGTESATVVELYRHPEDIEYVQLIPEFTGGAAGG